jgi:hypothetical protein
MDSTTAQHTLQVAARAFKNPHLPAYCHWKYADEPVCARGSVAYPISTYPASAKQIGRPDSILGELASEQISTDDIIGDTTYRNLIAASGRHLFNGRSYISQRISAGEQIKIESGMGYYFDMLDSCDALEFEACSHAEMLTGDTISDFQAFDKQLAQRQRLHAHVARPALDGTFRSVAIGISLLVAYRKDNAYHLILHRRSPHLALYPGMIHVAPAFMFQPMTTRINDEYSLIDQIEREYLEELFDVPEAVDTETNPYYFKDDPHLAALHSMQATEAVSLYLTGITVNLLNLRAEVCALLLAHTDEWYERHIATKDPAMHLQINAEYSGVGADVHAASWQVKPSDTDADLLAHFPLQPWEIVPSAAGAFWLGIDTLRRSG